MAKKYHMSGADISLVFSLKIIMTEYKSICPELDSHTQSTFDWMEKYIECKETGKSVLGAPNQVKANLEVLPNKTKDNLENHLAPKLGGFVKQAVQG